jgi:hypothetical protein
MEIRKNKRVGRTFLYKTGFIPLMTFVKKVKVLLRENSKR